MSEKDKKGVVDIRRIMEMIPHRYPILLIDRILELDPGQSAVGLKNVTMNEPHFMGHFPDHPIMPGVLIIEALAQTSAVVCVASMEGDPKDKVVYFMTIDNARFRKPVVPGDTLHLHVTKTHSRGAVWKFKGEARVDGQLCAEATFSAMLADK